MFFFFFFLFNKKGILLGTPTNQIFFQASLDPSLGEIICLLDELEH